MVNWGKDWHHIAINLFDNLHVAHDTDFDISLFDDITARFDQMRMADISRGLEFKEHLNFTAWWEKYRVWSSDAVILLALLLAVLFPMLKLVYLRDHLDFFVFREVFVWILNRELIGLSLFGFVLNWNGHKVNISWNDWYLY